MNGGFILGSARVIRQRLSFGRSISSFTVNVAVDGVGGGAGLRVREVTGVGLGELLPFIPILQLSHRLCCHIVSMNGGFILGSARVIRQRFSHRLCCCNCCQCHEARHSAFFNIALAKT